MAPLIGITTAGRRERHVSSIHYAEFYALAALYVDAVRRAGGVPVLLPPGEAHWQQTLSPLDGVVVTGGVDINPARYGGDVNHPTLNTLDLERDETDIALAQYLVQAQRWPALFICRGMQVLNVALGGTLYEHVPEVLQEDIHRGPDGSWATHDVDIFAGSRLYDITGCETATIQSGHHQAVRQVAPGVVVTSKAPDGVIEALEIPDHPWLVAVQWHPEASAAHDAVQQAIFDALVQAAGK